jgi:hypothetical protein
MLRVFVHMQLSATQAELLTLRAEANDLQHRLADGHAALNKWVEGQVVGMMRACLRRFTSHLAGILTAVAAARHANLVVKRCWRTCVC